MQALYIYLAIIGTGSVSAAIVVGRYVPSIKSLSRDDQRKWLDRLPPFLEFAEEFWHNHVRPPVARFWNRHIHPIFLGEGEKWSRRSRIVAQRIERLFHRMSDYFRGRRIAIQGNGSGIEAQGKNSQFWNEIQRLKSEDGKKK
ncbi:MAG: hypothetical protein HYS44_03305 [Candidatus Niyogibacteria bacterium]|nr:hypothetical protein [Candidatus Niyogibacteria bacterium]